MSNTDDEALIRLLHSLNIVDVVTCSYLGNYTTGTTGSKTTAISSDDINVIWESALKTIANMTQWMMTYQTYPTKKGPILELESTPDTKLCNNGFGLSPSSGDLRSLFTANSLYVAAMKDNHNPDAIATIVKNLCYNNVNFSQGLIAVMLERVQESDYNIFFIFFFLLSSNSFSKSN